MFSTVRISAVLADALLEKRKRHARSPLRTVLHPNDEAFVATTAATGFGMVDINSVMGPWYHPDSFDYEVTIDGDTISANGKAQLLHSVRWGADVAGRLIYPSTEKSVLSRAREGLIKKVLPYTSW
jgi:hypothetical protein